MIFLFTPLKKTTDPSFSEIARPGITVFPLWFSLPRPLSIIPPKCDDSLLPQSPTSLFFFFFFFFFFFPLDFRLYRLFTAASRPPWQHREREREKRGDNSGEGFPHTHTKIDLWTCVRNALRESRPRSYILLLSAINLAGKVERGETEQPRRE